MAEVSSYLGLYSGQTQGLRIGSKNSSESLSQKRREDFFYNFKDKVYLRLDSINQ